ncbi:MAG: hypothetical protein ACREKM_11295, partial [Longimicrobiales bacterium]
MMRNRKYLAIALVSVLTFAACDDDDGGTGPVQLTKPTNVTAVRSGADVNVSWNAVTGAETYTVERDQLGDAAGFAAVESGLTTTSYTDVGVPTDAAFQYRVIAVRGTEESPASDPKEVLEVGPAEAQLPPEITGELVLSADTTYFIRGIVTVDSGAVLRIPAGTLLLGDVNTSPSALIVRRGGQIFAEGTADAPIVFTSSAPAGQRQRGDWGGVVLNGRSTCNFPAGECVGEGTSGSYGGNILDDNSGVLRYVRIEFAGYEVSLGNELNALTLNGVGSGTEISYIQVHYGSDDGIEWFGGTVDVKYAIATGISDDSFDYSTGWSGRGQFWIAQQDPADGDFGWEIDNNENDYDATPRTSPTVYNVTLVGGGDAGSATESPAGVLYRRGAAGDIANMIISGFKIGLDIDNDETVAQCAAGALTMQGVIIHSNGEPIATDDALQQTCEATAGFDLRYVDPQLAAAFDRTNPDFRPAAGSDATQNAIAVPAGDTWFTAVDFIGAVGTGAEEWYEGWT